MALKKKESMRPHPPLPVLTRPSDFIGSALSSSARRINCRYCHMCAGRQNLQPTAAHRRAPCARRRAAFLCSAVSRVVAAHTPPQVSVPGEGLRERNNITTDRAHFLHSCPHLDNLSVRPKAHGSAPAPCAGTQRGKRLSCLPPRPA